MDSFSDVATYWSSSKTTRKIDLQPILIKNSSHAHLESKSNMLVVTGKLVKYLIQISLHKVRKQQTTYFGLKEF
jgi:hypothetical protein